jgi:NB-ARC domain/Rx N-terminal domain
MEVAHFVAGEFASAVISKLINEFIDYAKDQKKMQLGLKDELKRLKKALPKIQAVVTAVDQGLIKEKNPPLEKWLWQLRDAAYQADNVMDEIEYNLVKENVEARKNKVSKAVSTIKTVFERAVYKDVFLERLKEAVKEIDDVAADVEVFYKLAKDLVKNQQKEMVDSAMGRETSSVLNPETIVFGREKEEEDIIKKLLNPECKVEGTANFAVLPIIGVGGIGKTALAQLVYNDPKVEKHFELRMWVCVSNNFNVTRLTKKLYESAFGQPANFVNLDTIQRELKEKLKSKRFLVVFDDVWDDADIIGWQNLVAPLQSKKSGSMMLLTARMKKTAMLTAPNVMDPFYLKGLNEADMQDLLERCAFGGEDPNKHKQLVEIGRKIVKNLKGCPLAAKTVGRILGSRLNVIHWTRILKSELWSLEQEPSEIMPALRLTYQYLPSHLKPCFSFCSIFPQDHIFIKDDLIYMWMALGLVPRVLLNGERPEDVGSVYFEEMLNRSIFSPANPISNAHLCYPVYAYCPTTEKQFVGGYVMHDLMHDLSAFVSQGECFRSDTNKIVPIPTTVRHLYIRVDDCSELCNLNLKNIRTLILQFDDSKHPELVCILNEMLKAMRSLRLLTLFALELREIPESVSDLLHLRYLSLSSFMLGEFPRSMSRLHHLETMVCGGFGFDKQANVLVELVKLRHIIASECFIQAIAGTGRLTSLQELCFRVDKKSEFKISELSNMRELRRLSISNINSVGDHEEVKEANLRDKVGLRELSLQWETLEFDEKVFYHLEPNCNLEELRIIKYMGGRPPAWETGRLQSLVKIEFSDCHNLIISLDEWLPRFPKIFAALEELTITCCKKVEMPQECFSKFMTLKRLDISGCHQERELSYMDVLFLPSTLQFVRINNYVEDVRELSLQPKEASFVVLDHPGDNRKLSYMRMGDHVGRWPPIWLTQTLSTLESLHIVGAEYLGSSATPDGEALPAWMRALVHIIRREDTTCAYPPLEYPSDMPSLEQTYWASKNIQWMQHVKHLTFCLLSKLRVLPPLPITLEKLILTKLGWVLVPNLFENQSSGSGRLPCLVSMAIFDCPNLISLAEGLFQEPQQFEALETLTIRNCKMLKYLPQGGFNKFISLKWLDIESCPRIPGQLVQECFLPSALRVLRVFRCGGLEAILHKALESVHSLISLELIDCYEITSLPSEEVFSRWRSLEKLYFAYCPELTSLESLVGLCSIKQLIITKCPKLVLAITPPSAWKKDEIEGIAEDSTMQTSSGSASTQPTPTNPSSSTRMNQKPLLSIGELRIDDPLLLCIEPIRSISAVQKLTITECSNLQSLPELPPVGEELSRILWS